MSSDTQQQILDAVQAVIVRDGVRGATMRQVAEEADVSLGLLSYHFDDKDTLILEAFGRATRRLLRASHEAIVDLADPAERVRQFLRGSFASEFLDGDYLRLRISFWAVALTDPAVGKLDAQFFADYDQALRALIAAARPSLTDDQVRQRSMAAITMSNGVWLNWARYGNRADLDDGLALSESLALDGPVP